MANTFTPQVELGVVGGNVPVYADAKCTQRTQVLDLNGNPLRGNALNVPEGGVPAPFQATPTTVYFRHSNGTIVSLTSGGATAVTSTTGAALPTVILKLQGV